MKNSLPTKPQKTKLAACALALCAMLGGCASQGLPPIAAVPKVDLPRFMGDWYVIACIPTFIETEAYNAVESYKLLSDGSIDTTFTFNKDSLEGPAKRYNPHGYVVENTNNAVWDMQFIWPIKSEYIIAHLDDDYATTIVARNARDYVWIMARTPSLSDAKYSELTGMVAKLGYDTAKLRKVPHQQSGQSNQPNK